MSPHQEWVKTRDGWSIIVRQNNYRYRSHHDTKLTDDTWYLMIGFGGISVSSRYHQGISFVTTCCRHVSDMLLTLPTKKTKMSKFWHIKTNKPKISITMKIIQTTNNSKFSISNHISYFALIKNRWKMASNKSNMQIDNSVVKNHIEAGLYRTNVLIKNDATTHPEEH